MPLKIEHINEFLGFGQEGRRGEYYFSSGMKREGRGTQMGWWIAQSTSGSTVAGLKIMNWFSERDESGTAYIYGVAEDGEVYKVEDGANTWASVRESTVVTKGNGLITDQKGRILYLQYRYLGMYDGAWTDNWKDFGTGFPSTTDPRPADLYEDWVVMGNGSTVSLLNTTDDSFTAAAFTLPEKFETYTLKSGKGGVLIGANFSERGVLILWDCQTDRSLAPWIWLDGKVNGIAKYEGIWIVSTGRKYIITNGYRILDIIEPPCPTIAGITTLVPFGPRYPSGMIVHENHLLVQSSSGAVSSYFINRERKGVYIYDFRTRLWEFCPSATRWDHNVKALFVSSSFRIYTAFEVNLGKVYVGRLIKRTTNPTQKAFLISSPLGKGNSQKMAEGIVLGLRFAMDEVEVYDDPDFSVKIKLYNFERQLWGLGITNFVSTDKGILRVNGTTTLAFNHVEVGDEITIMEGVNAGETRHIVSIANGGTATEQWTMDSDFTNLTETDMKMNIMPFRLVGSKTIDKMKVKKNRLYIPITKSIEGKHFMIKIQFDNTSGYMTPHIESLSFIYNDLGIQ